MAQYYVQSIDMEEMVEATDPTAAAVKALIITHHKLRQFDVGRVIYVSQHGWAEMHDCPEEDVFLSTEAIQEAAGFAPRVANT